MGGMTMWIILGSLIGVVVIFLLVTTTLDRKKKKKIMVEKKEIALEVKDSGSNVSKEIKKIITKNTKDLKEFVPSIGKLKMSDINNNASKELKKIQQTKDFKLIKHNEEEYVLFSKHIKSLIATKSNNWDKLCSKDLEFFVNYKPFKKVEKQELKKPKKPKKVKKVKTKGKK